MAEKFEKLTTEKDYEEFLEYIFSLETVTITDEKIMEAINIYLGKGEDVR